MTKLAEDILEKAMALDDADKAEVADRLAEALESEIDSNDTAAWEVEIRRRIDQVQRGETTPIPWRDAIDQIIRGQRDDT